MRIAEHILLLGKFALGIQYLQVEIGVGELHDDVALAHMGTLIHHFLCDDAALLAADLHHGDRYHLSIHRNIVIKLPMLHLCDAQSLAIHL